MTINGDVVDSVDIANQWPQLYTVSNSTIELHYHSWWISNAGKWVWSISTRHIASVSWMLNH